MLQREGFKKTKTGSIGNRPIVLGNYIEKMIIRFKRCSGKCLIQTI